MAPSRVPVVVSPAVTLTWTATRVVLANRTQPSYTAVALEWADVPETIAALLRVLQLERPEAVAALWRTLTAPDGAGDARGCASEGDR